LIFAAFCKIGGIGHAVLFSTHTHQLGLPFAAIVLAAILYGCTYSGRHIKKEKTVGILADKVKRKIRPI